MEIQFNGSKWAGDLPDSLDALLDVLTRETLDPMFEDYGNFVLPDQWPTLKVWGNFFTVSHAFSVTGTVAELTPLIDAIRANQATDAYKEARHQRFMEGRPRA